MKMLASDSQELIKLTTIRLLEEVLLEKVTKLGSDAIQEENSYLPSRTRQKAILNSSQGERLTVLEKYLSIPDEFWWLKAQWLQEAQQAAVNSKPSCNFFDDEVKEAISTYHQRYFETNESDGHQKSSNLVMALSDTPLVNLCAIQAATELMEKIDFHHLSLETLENLLGVTQKPAPVTETLLPVISALPTPPPFRAGVESNYRRDKWRRNANNWAVFESPCKTNPQNRVEVFIAGENDGDILAWEAALQILDLMGLDAAKIQLVFASHLFRKQDKAHGSFTLRCTNIFKQIGWDKKHRLTTPEKLAKLASITFHLGRMLMQCTWSEGKPKGNKIDASVSISPLWIIEIDARGQMNMLTGKVDKPTEVFINVSPGPWAEKWLNKFGAKANEALYQFGWLATEILKIDPYHDELALKLAIHLTMTSRIKAWNENQYEHRVGALLEAVELEARINAARQGYRQAYNLKQRWDSALELLMSMGWQVIFDEITYPEWLRPSSKAEKPQGWRKKKVIDWLLEAKLTIKPPEPIPALLKVKAKSKKLKPVRPKSEPLTAVQVRKAREAKRWNQRQLAGWLGVSQKLVSMIERGERTITPRMESKLRTLLDIEV